MKYRHMSSTKLSELSGVTYRCIKHYLDGTRTPSIKSLINISNALGCDIRDIADLDGFIE